MKDQMAPLTKPRKIFLSYSVNDRDFARRLSKLLGEAGVSTSSVGDLVMKDDTWEELRFRINDADRFVFVVPAREGDGKVALMELGAAKAFNKEIVAVMPNGSRTANSAVVNSLSHTSAIDASRLDESSLIRALTAA